MVMLEHSLLFVGLVALVATIGMFVDFGDKWTGVLVAFTASLLWAIFGLSSYDIIIDATASPPATESFTPLVYMGVGLAMITALFAINDLLHALRSDASTSVENVMR